MSDKAKELVIKTNIVVGLFFLLFLFPILPIISFFIDEKLLSFLFYTDLILFFITGIILLILLSLFGLKQKPVKAEKIDSVFENFEELSKHFEIATSNLGYKKQNSIYLNDQGEMLLFTRKKFWALNCLVLIRVPELTEDILNTSNEKFKEFLSDYYGTDAITDWLSLISLVCVDRITPSFQKFVNSNIKQEFKRYKLPVGVSFGGNTIYISNQKDGLAIGNYKKLRKEFLKLLTTKII